MNAAIVTARTRGPALPEKNLYLVGGRPLVDYPIRAALEARRVDRVYCSTDGDDIADVARELGCEIIRRPEGVAGDVPHAVVIRHAVEEVARRTGRVDLVAILLGNTVAVDAPLIDQAMGRLAAEPRLSGVMSVWRAQDDHPLRALAMDNDGLLRPYGGARDVSSSRQTYPACYYYDQGVWAFRAEWGLQNQGPNPWTWMGPRCAAIERPWVTGRDVHTDLDVAVSEWMVTREIPCMAPAREEDA